MIGLMIPSATGTADMQRTLFGEEVFVREDNSICIRFVYTCLDDSNSEDKIPPPIYKFMNRDKQIPHRGFIGYDSSWIENGEVVLKGNAGTVPKKNIMIELVWQQYDDQPFGSTGMMTQPLGKFKAEHLGHGDFISTIKIRNTYPEGLINIYAIVDGQMKVEVGNTMQEVMKGENKSYFELWKEVPYVSPLIYVTNSIKPIGAPADEFVKAPWAPSKLTNRLIDAFPNNVDFICSSANEKMKTIFDDDTFQKIEDLEKTKNWNVLIEDDTIEIDDKKVTHYNVLTFGRPLGDPILNTPHGDFHLSIGMNEENNNVDFDTIERDIQSALIPSKWWYIEESSLNQLPLEDIELSRTLYYPYLDKQIYNFYLIMLGWTESGFGSTDDVSLLEHYQNNREQFYTFSIPSNIYKEYDISGCSFKTTPITSKIGMQVNTSIEIPEWIKNNAGWWAEGQIDDNSFVQGIQFMIKENIISIPNLPESSSETAESVPGWVKNNAGWWAEGQIDDNSFVQGIEYLVKVGIIQVN